MANTGVYIEGLRETLRSLESVGAEVDDLKDVMGGIAAEAAAVMAPYIPVGKTGKLRASARPNRAKGKAVVTIGRASVPYAAVQNYGWPRRHITGAGFIARADAAMGDKAAQMLSDGLAQIIERNGF